MSEEDLMQAASELARLTGTAALRYYGGVVDVETKGDGSPVTIADRTAERLAREWLALRFPADGILGEELGVAQPGARRRWIIDPIDGTGTFVRRVPLWGSLVAVAEGATILAGAAFFPAVGEMLAAAAGCGCWWNDVRCRVSTLSDLSAATVLTTDDRFRGKETRLRGWQNLAARSSVARTWGDCYGYLLVATGRAEAMIDDIVSPWDAAALQPIITEAGGVFTNWNGEHTAFGEDVIATNARLAREVREHLLVPSPSGVTANA